MSSKLQNAMHVVGKHLDNIEREVFLPGSGMRFTFIARDPSNPEADFLMTSDDLAEVAKVIERSGHREIVGARLPNE